MKDLQQTLTSFNPNILLLLMSYGVSRFKFLSMCWYRSMKPFQTNLNLVIIFFNRMNGSFPVVAFSSNDLMWIKTSKKIFFYIYNSIIFDD